LRKGRGCVIPNGSTGQWRIALLVPSKAEGISLTKNPSADAFTFSPTDNCPLTTEDSRTPRAPLTRVRAVCYPYNASEFRHFCGVTSPDGARNQASRSHARNPGRKCEPGRRDVPPSGGSRGIWRRRVLPHRNERPRRRHQCVSLRQSGKTGKENS